MKVKAILGALQAVTGWVKANPEITMGVVNTVTKIKADLKTASIEDQLQIVDEKLNQVGAAALELEQKIELEVVEINNEIETLRKEMKIFKKIISILAAVLGAAIIAIILLAIL